MILHKEREEMSLESERSQRDAESLKALTRTVEKEES